MPSSTTDLPCDGSMTAPSAVVTSSSVMSAIATRGLERGFHAMRHAKRLNGDGGDNGHLPVSFDFAVCDSFLERAFQHLMRRDAELLQEFAHGDLGFAHIIA